IRIAATTFEQVLEWRDDADAHDVVVERDVPEPAILVSGLNDERRALVLAGRALCALPVRPDRALVENRIPHPQAKTVHEQTILSAGVDDDLRAHLADATVGMFDRDADGAIAVEQHVSHTHTFVCDHAMLARVLEHYLIELAAYDLPRLRAGSRLVVPEV